MNELLSQSERKYSIIVHELEEIRLSLEQSERAKKNIENDLHDATDKISELNTQYANMSATKRKLENDLNSAQNDLSDMDNDLKSTEEKLRKSLMEQLKLEDELKLEREHLAKSDSLRKDLELQLKDFQLRLNEAETNALKGGKRLVQKLEQRINELETQLDYENKHNQDTLKEMKKNDKRIKDLIIQSEDDRRNQIKLQELIEALQNKIKIYKRQTEEAEEIASNNLSKYRKLQVEYESIQNDRSESNQSNKLLNLRSRNREKTIVSIEQRSKSVNRNASVLRNQQ
jgi:myosin heavy chain 6/7